MVTYLIYIYIIIYILVWTHTSHTYSSLDHLHGVCDHTWTSVMSPRALGLGRGTPAGGRRQWRRQVLIWSRGRWRQSGSTSRSSKRAKVRRANEGRIDRLGGTGWWLGKQNRRGGGSAKPSTGRVDRMLGQTGRGAGRGRRGRGLDRDTGRLARVQNFQFYT